MSDIVIKYVIHKKYAIPELMAPSKNASSVPPQALASREGLAQTLPLEIVT